MERKKFSGTNRPTLSVSWLNVQVVIDFGRYIFYSGLCRVRECRTDKFSLRGLAEWSSDLVTTGAVPQ